MPRANTVFQIFVASPSDVSEERDILAAIINEQNTLWSKELGVSFELLRWETNTHPTLTGDPQGSINHQIGLEYDIFIGIFWCRIGTQTLHAESGTIEEFHKAQERFEETGATPEIMLYFKESPPPYEVDVEQFGKLKKFRSSIQNKALVATFKDCNGFESSMRSHLAMLAQRFSSKLKNNKVQSPAESPPTIAGNAGDQDEELGFLDYLESYEGCAAKMANAIGKISVATQLIGEQLTLRTREIQEGASGNTQNSKRLIKGAADNLNDFAHTLSVHLPVLTSSRLEAFQSLSNALAAHQEFSVNTEEIRDTRASLESLANVTQSTKLSVFGLRTSANNMPRLSKDLNLAKRAVVAHLDEYLLECDNILSTIHNIISSIDNMLQINNKDN